MTMNFNTQELFIIAPEIGAVGLALIVLLTELFITRRHDVLQWLTVAGLAVIVGLVFQSIGGTTVGFSGMVVIDNMTRLMKLLSAGTALFAVLMSQDYWRDKTVRLGEYFSVLLLTTAGMMFLMSANDLITFFLGLETMSIGLYILAGSQPSNPKSSESALKYMLLGAFASGFLLYGMALIYGFSGGNTNFAEIANHIMGSPKGSFTLYAGIGLMMVGLLFKVAAVPFHFWSPDVYTGAPTPITAFMSTGPKAAAFAIFFRLVTVAFPDLSAVWQPVIWGIAILTMTVGNIIAIAQTNIKRMLAYSSISHAGYLLIAILSAGNGAVREVAANGMFFYLTAYYLMNVGAFAIAIIIRRAEGSKEYDIESYYGLASRNPYLAGAMALFMISLAGIPPTAGFIGKLMVFSAGIKAGYTGLVVIAVLNSAVSVFYYLRIVVYMYMKPAVVTSKAKYSPAILAVIVIAALGILAFGIRPGALIKQTLPGSPQVSVISNNQITTAPPLAMGR